MKVDFRRSVLSDENRPSKREKLSNLGILLGHLYNLPWHSPNKSSGVLLLYMLLSICLVQGSSELGAIGAMPSTLAHDSFRACLVSEEWNEMDRNGLDAAPMNSSNIHHWKGIHMIQKLFELCNISACLLVSIDMKKCIFSTVGRSRYYNISRTSQSVKPSTPTQKNKSI